VGLHLQTPTEASPLGPGPRTPDQDMAIGPVFVTRPNSTHHSLNPTQPNPSMKNIPLHTITTVMSQRKILQGPLVANVKLNYIK